MERGEGRLKFNPVPFVLLGHKSQLLDLRRIIMQSINDICRWDKVWQKEAMKVECEG